VIGNAVRVMEIATGQRDEEYEDDPGTRPPPSWAARAAWIFEKRPYELCAKLEHADLARALGGSVQAVPQARLSNG
jgi:hypothetical protein